ncbi:MAG: alkyl sulfatase dimerization domain-containing protein [Acidimicrobiales bacterium]
MPTATPRTCGSTCRWRRGPAGVALPRADALLDHAQRAFDEGDYRWVAEVVNHLVFADPTNERARELQADAFEQLGYQSESATWRNAYLTGAQELRNGPPPARPALRRGLVEALTVDLMFDAIAIRLQDELVAGERAEINWTFTDIDADSGQRDCAGTRTPGAALRRRSP